MLGIQIIGILFAIFMLYITFLHFKRKEFKVFEFILWLILWLGLGLIAVVPNILDFLVKRTLGLSRPLDFYIIVGFLFLIATNFYTYTMAKTNSKKLEKVVREVAFKK